MQTPPFSISDGERGRGGEGYTAILFAVLFLLIVPRNARAFEPPPTILVLVSGATLDDLQPGGRLPAVRELAERGGVALLHNGVWGDYNANAAYLSVGSGERMAAPATGDLSAEALRRFQPNVAERPRKVGALGAVLAEHDVDVRLLGDHAVGSLVAAPTNHGAKPAVVVSCATFAEADDMAQRFLHGKRVLYSRILFAAPDTPEVRGGAPYRRLGFVVAVGDGIAPGTLLTSPTTRTPGLVANVDIAPTISERYGTVIPGSAGQPIRVWERKGSRWKTLMRLDWQHNAAARATTPVLGGYGIFAGCVCLFAVFAVQNRRQRALLGARFGLLTAAGALPTLLAVGALAPQTPLLYGGTVAFFAVGIAAVAHFACQRLRFDPLRAVFTLLVGMIVCDTFAHTRLVESSLLSASTLTGIRFYGIGNEWFGLFVGAAIALRVPWYGAVLIVCADGLPQFGADAGGTLAATTAFVILFTAERTAKLGVRHVAAAFGAGVAVTALFALLDRFLPGAARSHVGAAVAAGQGANGWHRVADIAMRKLALGAGLFVKSWSLIAIGTVVLVAVLIGRSGRGTPLPRPVYAAAITGATVALFFNDGGLAAGLLLLVPVLVAHLYALLRDAPDAAQPEPVVL